MTGSEIVIVGGGFSGVLSAVRLLQSGAGIVSLITLIEPRAMLGRGLAYGTSDANHLLNVPAGQMSALSEDPQHFLRYAQLHDSQITADCFVPRKTYGEYLGWLLRTSLEKSPGIRFEHVQDSVVDIEPEPVRGATLHTAGGRTLHADKIIVACGHVASRKLIGSLPAGVQQEALTSARYIDSPWQGQALAEIDRNRPVVLLGSGLTAVDVSCSLLARGFNGPIHMVSRRGLKPLAHRPCSGTQVSITTTMALLRSMVRLRSGLRALRNHVRLAQQQGQDWRDVLAALRPHIPAIWQQWSIDERRRFLRHLQTFWDVHRHRVAPHIGATVERLLNSQQLQQHTGRITALKKSDGGLRISITSRDGSNVFEIEAGTVINCTGVCTHLEHIVDPLLPALQKRGLCRQDPLRLGIECTDDYALLDQYGRASNSLFYVGPWLRSRYWEATAVPELRLHVTRLVTGLLNSGRISALTMSPPIRAHA